MSAHAFAPSIGGSPAARQLHCPPHALGVGQVCAGKRGSACLLAKKGLDPFEDKARAGWKETGESLSKAASSRVPDAITQTENTAKRQQNAAMRSRQAAFDMDEPEALRRMREERERQEAEEVAMKDAARRAEEKNFVAGQDLRESRLIDEYERQKKEKEGAEEASKGDIRARVKSMQGLEKRLRVDSEALLHQSMLNMQPLEEELAEIVMRHHEATRQTAEKANAWMNGSFRIKSGRLLDITNSHMRIRSVVVRTNFFGKEAEEEQEMQVDYLDGKTCDDADSLKMRIIELLQSCDLFRSTASILSMPVGSRGWSVPDHLFLNEIPCNTEIREWFYRDVCDAVQVALQDSRFLESCAGRLKIECVPPELNPEMDSFRVGTMLEMVREIAIRVGVVMGRRVKVCIQGSLGEGIFTGMPLMLNGMRRVMESMDWQARPGEMYEGLLINVFIIIAPQSMVGASVYEPLSQMVEAAGPKRTVILINPRLKDRPSSGNVMSVQGRSQRIAFAASFREIFHFRLLYTGTTFMFPIQGALRMNMANSPFWTLFKRETTTTPDERTGESYQPIAVFAEEPKTEAITNMMNGD
ncbi:hypothetical protein GUITHDRAFT_110795 [Guillardia theta CCMP2712]|uniref:DUF1995 domain-containing protein n=1 Tax=Guillardia theta (strain CCMP2712) TaxID=905079 RepID=L1J4P9_GUITC|nr:hypothetical protein GUITHDRAFT_110795 [Guillardia theta CCMP2712]EKX43070.1 hypothetical protein GUITHDRAFT_110795 [Guillardia theta CCMP2712]|eukprot:XP_005830050.1 hypothetical protein GUITHDRAFT_110795 [Guillardia theta CCMP2712]